MSPRIERPLSSTEESCKSGLPEIVGVLAVDLPSSIDIRRWRVFEERICLRWWADLTRSLKAEVSADLDEDSPGSGGEKIVVVGTHLVVCMCISEHSTFG
jgi:hypothetical protein